MMSDEVNRTIEINLKNCENVILSENDIPKCNENLRMNGYFDKFHKDELTYGTFFKNYLVPNIPVVITGISDTWECMNWTRTKQNSNQHCDINFEYLKNKIGEDVKVPVASCQIECCNSDKKLELNFHEYIEYWREKVKKCSDHNPLPGDETEKLLYLKDWHLTRQLPAYHYYETPLYFSSDWLNEYCEERALDDYRFVYMGPKGTWYMIIKHNVQDHYLIFNYIYFTGLPFIWMFSLHSAGPQI